MLAASVVLKRAVGALRSDDFAWDYGRGGSAASTLPAGPRVVVTLVSGALAGVVTALVLGGGIDPAALLRLTPRD